MARKGENIYKRKDGRWEGRYKSGFDSQGQTRYKSVYGKTYSEVKSILTKKKSDILKGISSCVLTIREISSSWLDGISQRIKESTNAVYITKLEKYILPELGGIKIDALSVDVINDFTEKIVSAGLSDKYISDIISVLKSILKYAAKIYGCADKSCYITIPRREKSKETITLKRDEEHKLIKSLCNDPTSSNTAILLAMTTGMRIGEICALKWSDIDLEKRIITVNHTVQRVRTFKNNQKTKVIETSPKSIKSKREIPIPDAVYDFLKSVQNNPENYLISATDKITEPRTMQYRFKSILKKENLPSVTFHSLRHLFASKCITIGVDVKTLSELLGHSSVEITLNRYVHSSNNRKIECMKLFSDSLSCI